MSLLYRLAPGVLAALAVSGVYSQKPADAEFFEKRMRPVLNARCYGCHSGAAKAVQSGLLLDSREGARKGGDSGHPAVVPSDPAGSALLSAIKQTGPIKMPPG